MATKSVVSDLEAVFFKIVANFKLDVYLKFRTIDKRLRCILFFFSKSANSSYLSENDEDFDSHTSKVLNFVTEYALITKKKNKD